MSDKFNEDRIKELLALLEKLDGKLLLELLKRLGFLSSLNPHPAQNAPIPVFEFVNNGDACNTTWRITPPSPGNGYYYYTGLYQNQYVARTGITMQSAVETAVQNNIDPSTGQFTYSIPASVHGNPANSTPQEFVFVVTRTSNGSQQKIVASCTIHIRKST